MSTASEVGVNMAYKGEEGARPKGTSLMGTGVTRNALGMAVWSPVIEQIDGSWEREAVLSAVTQTGQY